MSKNLLEILLLCSPYMKKKEENKTNTIKVPEDILLKINNNASIKKNVRFMMFYNLDAELNDFAKTINYKL